tara:strand:+ start:366 stop:869 length:504 start_codon:yes stop_codon:yes gene_type:complete
MQVALSKSKSSQALQSLTTTSPKEIEQTVLSSMESILNFKENLNRDFSVRSYELTEEPTADQRAKADKLMAFAMTPMPLDQMEDKLLQTMMVMVKPSQESQQDIAMRIRLIAVGLEDFPADIFLFAVKHISRTKTFFPSLAEFREAGEWRYQKRLMLQEMLQKRTKR